MIRFIHDEMYGVDLDLAGNYLLLGGSGDEYSYSATNADGWMSDIWVSYLVVVDPQVNQRAQGSRWEQKCSKIMSTLTQSNGSIY